MGNLNTFKGKFLQKRQLLDKSEELNEIFGSHLKNSRYAIICGLEETENFPKNPEGDFIDYCNPYEKYIDSSLSIDGCYFSYINGNNKYSEKYINCTSIIAIGEDKETGQNISFLTHQDPDFFLFNDYFDKKLVLKLEELKKRSKEGTIDIVILGGNTNNKLEQYKKSIKLLDEIIFDNIGFHPVIVGGPSDNMNYINNKHIYLDTKNRRITYYKTANINPTNIVFLPKELKDKNFILNRLQSWYKKIIGALYRKKDYLSYLQQAIKDVPNNIVFYEYLLSYYEEKNDIEKQIQILEKIIKVFPRNIKAYEKLISIYEKYFDYMDRIQKIFGLYG